MEMLGRILIRPVHGLQQLVMIHAENHPSAVSVAVFELSMSLAQDLKWEQYTSDLMSVLSSLSQSLVPKAASRQMGLPDTLRY
ncbi:uncharacterized protein Z519_06038 [Cladophialophora bantiana CBS 173.52]|uniref:Uncharacterized protein n=1 Tax=Cladophialophora bantiana (strain ATCC 10958 / CBS 173.52 / CDC B-1940 / NIH 8579) TaxID=1442370 RepID=A0A0D2HJH1_CLAB1|nr:uncharacterized protein Z519_06038 [Cladophialophora bantiana CBS 173.52]KIW93433.1 hypothetical protein Z519_06038 [Cladophialophora bantiana CBS 173.52]